MSVEFLKVSNLVVSFFVELCALIALGYWGFHVGNNGLLKIAFCILVPLLTAFVWGIFLAPKSSKRLQGWMNVCLKLLVFGFSIVALWVTGLHSIAIILGIIVIMNRLFAYLEPAIEFSTSLLIEEPMPKLLWRAIGSQEENYNHNGDYGGRNITLLQIS